VEEGTNDVDIAEILEMKKIALLNGSRDCPSLDMVISKCIGFDGVVPTRLPATHA
jgi:hypothetical protein